MKSYFFKYPKEFLSISIEALDSQIYKSKIYLNYDNIIIIELIFEENVDKDFSIIIDC